MYNEGKSKRDHQEIRDDRDREKSRERGRARRDSIERGENRVQTGRADPNHDRDDRQHYIKGSTKSLYPFGSNNNFNNDRHFDTAGLNSSSGGQFNDNWNDRRLDHRHAQSRTADSQFRDSRDIRPGHYRGGYTASTGGGGGRGHNAGSFGGRGRRGSVGVNIDKTLGST